MWPKIKSWIEKNEPILYFSILLVILRIPSLFEPYWYGDEGIYLTIGQGLRRGLELYQEIHDNKPPLLYLVAAAANGQLFWFKFAALLTNLVALIVFSKLAQEWWGKTKSYVLSLLSFVLFTSLPTFEGNIANAENFFILFTTLSLYLVFSKHQKYHLALAGLALGVASLFKMPAILEAAVWPLFWIFTKDKAWFKKSLIFSLAALTPLFITILYFANRGSLNNYLVAAGLQNVPYLSSWQADVFLIGSLKARALLLMLFLGLVWICRKRFDSNILLLAAWFVISLFAALLSGRPYPHYLLQLAPSFALALGYVFSPKKLLVPAMLILVLFTAFQLFGFQRYATVNYYTNFLSWVSNRQTTNSYYQWFNPSLNQAYQIAKTVMQGSVPTDKIFVWGDMPAIYALSKRLPVGIYTVKYHILDFGAQAKTIKSLEEAPPRFIVTFNNDLSLPGLPRLLTHQYVLEREIGNAQIYRFRSALGYN